MQSKKRFRETFVWDADWFMNLQAQEKLFWSYLNDHCNNIGIWEPNMRLAQFHICSEIKIDRFFERVNKGKERLLKRPDGSWLITGFVKFQYAQSNPLNPKNPAHRSYLNLMKERGLWNWYLENQPDLMPVEAPKIEVSKNSKRGLKEVSENHKDKDKEKAADTDKESDMEKAKDKDAHQSNGEIFPEPSISKYYKIAERLKEIIPNDCIEGLPKDIEEDVKKYYSLLEDKGISDPRAFIIGRATSTDWKGKNWVDHADEIFTEGTPAAVPF